MPGPARPVAPSYLDGKCRDQERSQLKPKMPPLVRYSMARRTSMWGLVSNVLRRLTRAAHRRSADDWTQSVEPNLVVE